MSQDESMEEKSRRALMYYMQQGQNTKPAASASTHTTTASDDEYDSETDEEAPTLSTDQAPQDAYHGNELAKPVVQNVIAVTAYTVKVGNAVQTWLHGLYMLALHAGYGDSFRTLERLVRDINGTPGSTPGMATMPLLKDVWAKVGARNLRVFVSTGSAVSHKWQTLPGNASVWTRALTFLTRAFADPAAFPIVAFIDANGMLYPIRISSFDDFVNYNAGVRTLGMAISIMNKGGAAYRGQTLVFPAEWLDSGKEYTSPDQSLSIGAAIEEDDDDEFAQAYERKMAQLKVSK